MLDFYNYFLKAKFIDLVNSFWIKFVNASKKFVLFFPFPFHKLQI